MYHYYIYTNKGTYLLRTKNAIGGWEACQWAQAELSKDHTISSSYRVGFDENDTNKEGLYSFVCETK